MDRGVAWADFEKDASGLATRVRACFERHQHAVLATLRRDGSPRLSGLGAPIRDGHLWLGTSPTARIASDLRRDARFALHSALDSEKVLIGDAKVEGLARPATEDEMDVFASGYDFEVDDPSSIALYTARLLRVVLTRVNGDKLNIDHWTPSQGRQLHSRS